jgi:DNA ligase-1
MISAAESNTQVSSLNTTNSIKTPVASCDFGAFAKLCDKVDKTDRKAEKSELIAAYFQTLDPDSLVIASRYLAGYVFPIRERRLVNVSALIIINSIAACAGVPPSFVKERVAYNSDLGQVAWDLYSSSLPIKVADRLTLSHLTSVLMQLSTMSGSRRKGDVIVKLLRQCDDLEAKYLVRLLVGDIAIGIHESDVEDAVSRWKDISLGRVQSANLLLGDIGETALLCSRGKIDDARMRLFKPINYMHANPVSIKDDFVKVMPESFIVEDKFDGIRVQVHVGLHAPGREMQSGIVYDGLRIVIFSDLLQDITSQFEELVPGLSALLSEQAGTVDTVGVILDGQIVPVMEGEVLPFPELRRRLEAQVAGDKNANDIPVGFAAFDLLFGDGRSLIQEDWTTRAGNLDKIRFDMITTFRARSTSASTVREVEAILQAAIGRGSQGVVIKSPRSTYKPGRRGNDWLKIYADQYEAPIPSA